MLVRASPSSSSSAAPVWSTLSSTRKSTSLASVREFLSFSVHSYSERNDSISVARLKTIRRSMSGRESRSLVPVVDPYAPVVMDPSRRLLSSGGRMVVYAELPVPQPGASSHLGNGLGCRCGGGRCQVPFIAYVVAEIARVATQP